VRNRPPSGKRDASDLFERLCKPRWFFNEGHNEVIRANIVKIPRMYKHVRVTKQAVGGRLPFSVYRKRDVKAALRFNKITTGKSSYRCFATFLHPASVARQKCLPPGKDLRHGKLRDFTDRKKSIGDQFEGR